MKKIKLLNIFILIFICLFTFNIDVKAIKKVGSNYGASLAKISQGIDSGKLKMLDGDYVCFYKTYEITGNSLDDDYVVILFTIDSNTNKYMVVDITRTFANPEFERSNSSSYFEVDSDLFEKKSGKFGAVKWWEASTQNNYYVLKQQNDSINNVCSILKITFSDGNDNFMYLSDVENPRETMKWAKYTSMNNTSNYEYDDGTKVNEKQVLDKINKTERITEEDKIGCDINLNTKSLTSGKYYLEEDATYGWILSSGNQHLCFGEAMYDNTFRWTEIHDKDFDQQFKGHCNDYCVTSKVVGDGNTFCQGYYIKKDENGKCEYVSEDISTTSHSENSQVTSYVKYRNSNAAAINIYNDNNNITAEYGSKILSVSNISNYNTVFLNQESDNYPRYLIKGKRTDIYKFIDDIKDIEFDEVFINAKYLSELGIQGLGEEKIYSTCRDLFGDTFLTFLEENVFGVVRIGVIILLIVLTTFDFAKVVFVDDKEGIQNAFKNFKRRAIAAVLIFLTPTIIILIANLVGAGESVQDCAKTIRSMSTEVASDNE